MKPPRGSRRARVPTVALAVSVGITFVVATLVSRHFFEHADEHVAPRPPPSAAASGSLVLYRVAAVQGPVEGLHNGQWYVVQAGDQLPLQDVIRTPKGATVLLRRGASEVEVREDVDIRLDALASQTATFGLLRGGNVVTNVDDARQRVEITAAGTRAVNKGVARFVVKLDPSGQVSVAAAKGDVLFAAKGKEVDVPAGSESTARPGQAPDDPEPLPEELLLSVVWPEIEPKEARLPVTGKVRPTSSVKVNGVEAQVRPDGRFSAAVPLSVGANHVQVQAEDLLGHKKVVNKTVQRAASPPTLETTDEDLWKR